MSDRKNYAEQQGLPAAMTAALKTVLMEQPGNGLLRLTELLSEAVTSSNPYTSGMPYKFMTIAPTFSIVDWEKARPIMEDFVKATSSETGCIYYGWTKTADKLFCHEAYVDGDAVNAHLANVGPHVGALLKEAATLDSIKLHGPAGEINKCRAGMDGLGTVYYEVYDGFTNFKSFTSERSADQTIMTIQPTFNIKNWEKAKPIMDKFIVTTKSESGCIFYGWTKTTNLLFCREGYLDGKAVQAHLQNVGPLVGELLADKEVATLESIQLHGPAAEVAKCKADMDGLGTVYFETDSGFQKYEM